MAIRSYVTDHVGTLRGPDFETEAEAWDYNMVLHRRRLDAAGIIRDDSIIRHMRSKKKWAVTGSVTGNDPLTIGAEVKPITYGVSSW